MDIRKTLLQVETTLVEGGKAAPVPLKLFTAIAVVRKPLGRARLRGRSESPRSMPAQRSWASF